MQGLLDIATVIRGDGDWTAGAVSDHWACDRLTAAVGICAPGDLPDLGEENSGGNRIEPFAMYAAQKFGYRCGPKDFEPRLEKAFDASAEYLLSKVLWEGPAGVIGDWDGEVYLTHPDVTVVDLAPEVAGDDKAALAALLQAAHDAHPDIAEPVVHLGWLTAMKLATTLKDMGIDYVVGPGYPNLGLAVTGPIVIRLGSIDVTNQQMVATNRFVVEATRLASIDFDMCLAARTSSA